jgi:hypothetical protein
MCSSSTRNFLKPPFIIPVRSKYFLQHPVLQPPKSNTLKFSWQYLISNAVHVIVQKPKTRQLFDTLSPSSIYIYMYIYIYIYILLQLG